MSEKVILVTKNKADAEKHFRSLITSGFEMIYFPTIQICPKLDLEEVNRSIEDIGKYDWLIFTSINSVEVFACLTSKKNILFDEINIACVGSETAERCRQRNIKVNLVPEEFSALGLIKEFAKKDLLGKKILIPCSTLSRSELRLELTELGAEVTSIPVYDVVLNDEKNLDDELGIIKKKKPDLFVFTSPSSFNNYIKLMKIENGVEFFSNSIVCSIGKTTESAINALGVQVNIVPELFSLSGVQEAIKKYYKLEKNIA